MLQILYILAFTIVAFLAVGNLIRNLLTLGLESTRQVADGSYGKQLRRNATPPHPELLDEDGRIIQEPLLVMKSMSVDDARERLDAIYRSSPGGESNNSTSDRE
jgi:hypothetical protein